MTGILDAIKRELEKSQPVLDEEEVGSQQNVVIPTGLHLEQDLSGLTASIRWFSWTRLFLYLPFTLMCFLFVALLLWLSGKELLQNYFWWLFLILPLLVVGLFMTYLSLAVLVNGSTIQFTGGELCVHHGPLRVPGRLTVTTAVTDARLGLQLAPSLSSNRPLQYLDLDQIRTERVVECSGIPIPLFEYVSIDIPLKVDLYELIAILKNGERLALLAGPDYDVIHPLEIAIEKHLAILLYRAPMTS